MTNAMFAFSHNSYRVSNVYHKDCAGKLSEPSMVPPWKRVCVSIGLRLSDHEISMDSLVGRVHYLEICSTNID